MQMSSLLATAALAASASAAGGSPTTASLPGLTLTLPVGIDSSTTQITPPKTVTGNGAVISGVTVIVDSSSVYLVSGDSFAYGAASGTNALNDVTIVDGSIPGGSGTPMTMTNSNSASGSNSGSTTATPTPTTVTTTNSQGSTVVSTAQTTPTTKPNAGERAYGSVNMAAMAGVVAIAGAVANL